MEIEKWENTGREFVRHFVFKNQTELAEFVCIVAKYSDGVNHHADMEVTECRKLALRITTHDSDGITQKDFDWILGLEKILGTKNYK